MASIFDNAKKLVNKISDEINKDKWDSSVVNPALYPTETEAASDPASQEKKNGDENVVAAAPQMVQGTVKVQNVQEDINRNKSTEKPVVSKPEEEKKDGAKTLMPEYVKPVFRSRFSRPGTTVTPVPKEYKNADGYNKLNNLPKVDPSQSISHIATPVLQEDGTYAMPEPSAAVEVSAETTGPVPALQTPVAEASAPKPAIPPAAEASAPKPAIPLTAEETAPQPAIPPAGETAAAAPAEEAEEEFSSCYYVAITHTKMFPEKGSRVIMRTCDMSYVWTDSMDESDKPAYDICPNCGKSISRTETEMD